LFTLLYLVLIIVILFIPVSDYFYAIEHGINISKWNLFSTSLVLLAIAIIISTVSIKFGLNSFTKDF
jgi:fumarate reductase subunit D